METLHDLIVKRNRAKAVIIRNIYWQSSTKDNFTHGETIHRQEQIKTDFGELTDCWQMMEKFRGTSKNTFNLKHFFYIACAYDDLLHSVSQNPQNVGNPNVSSSNSDFNQGTQSGSLIGDGN